MGESEEMHNALMIRGSNSVSRLIHSPFSLLPPTDSSSLQVLSEKGNWEFEIGTLDSHHQHLGNPG
jgi:hypothetical protein